MSVYVEANDELDLFNIVHFTLEADYGSTLIKVEYTSGHYDNDASRPKNKIFVFHCNSNALR